MQVLTFNELPAAIQSIQGEIKEIRRLLSDEKPTLKNRLLTLGEAAKLLSLSKASIYRLVSQRNIPFHKSGGRLYFFEGELMNWIKTGRYETQVS